MRINNINKYRIMVKAKYYNNDSMTGEKSIGYFPAFNNIGSYIETKVVNNINDITARKLLNYIGSILIQNQTTIQMNVEGIKLALGVKSKDTVLNAINVLINSHCIARWKDIITEPNVVKPTRDWYLLNPNVVRKINIEELSHQIDNTCKSFNMAGGKIDEFSVLMIDEFDDLCYEVNRVPSPNNRKVASIVYNKRRGVKN